jgi:hypothetical protein
VIAAVNGPRRVVVAGRVEEVAAVERACADEGVRVSRLGVGHAFHSPLMAPMLTGFAEVLEGTEYQPAGQVALVSGLRAAWTRRAGVVVAAGIGILFVGLALTNNYRMLFQDFADIYRHGSWNTKDAGDVIRGLPLRSGQRRRPSRPLPALVRYALVGFEAGTPGVTMPSCAAIEGLAGEKAAQLFIVNTNDLETMEKLRQVFPEGVVQTFLSGIEGRDFWIFSVPPRGLAP